MPYHRTVAARLALVWLASCAIFGYGAYRFEVARTNAVAAEHGAALGARLAEHVGPLHDSAGPDQLEAFGQIARDAAASGFSSLRILDSAGLVVFDRALEPRSLPPPVAPAPPLAPGIEVSTEWHGLTPLMRIRLPIIARGTAIGMVEAAHPVDPELARRMVSQVETALALVVVISLATTAVMYPLIVHLHRGLLGRSSDLLASNVALMKALGSAVAKRDSETHLHNYRVTLYAVRLGQAAGVPDAEIAALITGAFLHDVGKIGIPDAILRKPGPLTRAEGEVMRTHVALGLEIIGGIAWLEPALDVVACHHEWYDGTGYPARLAGTAIPRVARIFAIVDVFDAITSERCYKPAATVPLALEGMLAESGTHFDPVLLHLFEGLAVREYAAVARTPEQRMSAEVRGLVERYLLKGEES